jgi:hypothetical protein
MILGIFAKLTSPVKSKRWYRASLAWLSRIDRAKTTGPKTGTPSVGFQTVALRTPLFRGPSQARPSRCRHGVVKWDLPGPLCGHRILQLGSILLRGGRSLRIREAISF